ncbi:MAG: adenylate/guanylate cyclase domain-containing protein [Actinobacteria bacterium]|nr:adenylate/guanylate cyclase domain-containing protein [Actinomycetota bacterium]
MGVIQPSPVQYAQSEDVHVAYQVVGEGERDLVLVQGFVSHLDLEWDNPHMARFIRGLAEFNRVILFDKRGTGLSDRSVGIPTLEERMDDVRAVMDAAGSEHAALMGVSEGAPMSILFAATYPQRTRALVLHGGMARSTEAPDYPWAAPAEVLVEAALEFLPESVLYSGDDLEIWAPSLANDSAAKAWLGRYRRAGVSPDGVAALYTMFLEIDVRDVLPTLRVPTLVLHRHGDRVVNWRAGRWMAEQIPGARYVDLPGQDHFPWSSDSDVVIEEIREFLTGVRVAPEPDRVLATVMFTDVARSTERAASLGDRRWKELLDDHDAAIRRQLEAFRGREVKTTGDGFLATFDGPARAIRCASAIRAAASDLGLDVRIGLHTGEVEVRADDIGGLAVHIGQRVSALAQPGEVLVSSTVKDLVAGSGIEFEERGEHELKGIPDRWRLFAVKT